MGSKGIRDQVAVIGMGCTRFGELWDKGVDDLLTDATTEAVAWCRAWSWPTSTPSGWAP